ncbi:MAG: hypothetical protein IJ797_06175 [Selenomonadaceae bacterium]|nr:hypothetical protein [Selenomonadaceae bacterium]
MMPDKVKMQDILRNVLLKDKNLLNSRDELIAQLDQVVPDDLRRDYNSIRKAIQDNNIGEYFLSNDDADKDQKDNIQTEVFNLLCESGMQSKRAQFVVDTFAGALNWNDNQLKEDMNVSSPIHTEEQDVSDEQIESSQQSESTPVVIPAQSIIPPNLPNHQSQPSQSSQPPPPPPQPPQPVQPSQPAQSNSDNKTKILMGIIIALLCAILFNVMKSNNNETSNNNAQMLQQAESQNNQSNVPNNNVPQNQPAQQTQPQQTQPQPQQVAKPSLPAESELSVGGISIGYSLDKVYSLIGRELSIETAKNDSSELRYQYPDNMVVVVKNGVVSAVVSRAPSSDTMRGVRVGSSLQDVLNAYGDSRMKSPYEDLMLYEYPFTSLNGRECLLRFAIKNNRVEYISARAVDNETTRSEPAPVPVRPVIDIGGARQAFIDYHNAITDGNYRAAYNMMTDNWQNHMGSYGSFVSGFSDTITSSVEDMSVVSSNPDKIVFDYILRARDRFGNRIQVQRFSGSVTMVRSGSRWYIANAHSRKINDWIE